MTARTFTFTVQAPPSGTGFPSPGNIATFTTNTPFDVRPQVASGSVPAVSWTSPTGNQGGVFSAWNGAAFAAELGSKGSVLFHGGGDNDYDGNEVYRLDINSGTWSRLNNPTLVTVSYGTYADNVAGEIKAAYGGGTGVIAALHTYTSSFYVPGAVGGNTNGFFCVGPTPSGAGKGYVHKCNLDTGVWSRASNNVAATNGYGYYPSGAWDSSRNRFWYVNQGSYRTSYYDWATGTWTQTAAAWTNTAYSTTPFAYCPTNDYLVLYESLGPSLNVLSAASPGAWTPVTMSGTLPPGSSNYKPLSWCSDLGCFLYYTGANSKTVYKLTPPAGAATGTWTWSSETLAGATPPYTTNGPLSKFQYVPSVKCAIYADGINSAAVAFRLMGT